MRADERALQLGALRGLDVAGGERAEAGADAVDRPARRGERLDVRARRLDRGDGLGGERDGRAVAGDGDDVFDGERAGSDDDSGYCGHGQPLDLADEQW